MTSNGQQAATQPAGFWKIRHAVIGFGVLLLIVVMVRSCGDEVEEEKVEAESENGVPRQGVVVEIPAQQWPGQYPPARQTPYQTQQQPYQMQQPYQTQQQPYQAPGYVQQQPAYGYGVQPPVPQYQPPTSDPDNPWAVQQQPAYGYSAQRATQAPTWGQPQYQRQPAYAQPSGRSRFRPLDERRRDDAQQSRAAPAPAPTPWTNPYDRRSGSSFGDSSAYPYSGAYPGYYGGTPYGVPGYGAGSYPGIGWPPY